MDPNQRIYLEDGIYLTPPAQVEEALRRMDNESRHADEESERGYKIYSPSESITSDVSAISEIEEVYVLQDTTTIPPQPEVSSTTQERKSDVGDLYDEDHYSVANTKNCPTQRFGALNQRSENQPRQLPTKRNKICLTKKWMKIIGLVVVLIGFGGICSLLITMFAGTTISINCSKNRFVFV